MGTDVLQELYSIGICSKRLLVNWIFIHLKGNCQIKKILWECLFIYGSWWKRHGIFHSLQPASTGACLQRTTNLYKRKLEQKHQASVFYKLDNINERQADILRLINDNPKILFTVKELQNRFSVTHTTAKNDIDGLVERKLIDEISLNKVKKGYVKGEMFDEIVKSIT